MEKKRARLITGWRQVTRARSKVSITRVPGARAKPPGPVPVPVRVADRAATERWEGEGGQLAGPPAP